MRASGGGSLVITGGAGADTIKMGGAAETLVFNNLASADSISGYSVAGDSIQLSKAVYTALTVAAGNPLAGPDFASVANAAALTGGSVAAATNAAGIIYVADTGSLYYNADGATAGGLTLIGTFAGSPALVVGEFAVIV